MSYCLVVDTADRAQWALTPGVFGEGGGEGGWRWRSDLPLVCLF